MRMTDSHPFASRPIGGNAALAAAGCGVLAFIVGMAETLTSAFADVPFPMSLPALGLMALGLGLREVSVRSQFAAQYRSFSASASELEAKNRWFAVTEGHAQVGHWRLDLRTNEVHWSDATFALHGLQPGNPPSLNEAINFYHEEDRGIVVDCIERARETGQPYTFRARIIDTHGDVRYVDAGASVECAVDATPVALFGVIKDRTGEEKMQSELRLARDEAHALAQAKGQFLARMSHEIRTPMNGLLGFAELLELSDLSPEQRRQIELIIASGKNLQALLDDILDLCKVEAGKTELHSTTLDIQTLLFKLKDVAEPLAREKGVRLLCKIDPDMPHEIEADALRLRQILSNFLSNAVRFTDAGIISITAHRDKGAFAFSVTDTGAGIASDRLEQIFDPLAQDQTNPTCLKNGTGLGLANSRQLVELMGGKLTVRSEHGQGSMFTLTLPDRLSLSSSNSPETNNRDAAETVAPTASTNTLQSQRKRSVLLVEDYEINRELVLGMAAKLRVSMECAENGAQAIATIRHANAKGDPFAMVFMDLQMPEMDGLEATRRIRADGFGEDELPIVALTANAFTDDVENCLAAGMQAHLAKPISMLRLREAMSKWAPHCLIPETDPSASL